MKYAWQKVKKGDKVYYHILTGKGENVEKVLTWSIATGEKFLGLIFLEDGRKLFSCDIEFIIRNNKEVL